MNNDKTRAYLDWYKKKYDSFKVGYEIYNGKFWKYFVYPSDEYDEWAGRGFKDYEAEHREVFPDEIVIETDMHYKRKNTNFAKMLCTRLRINGFSYSKWDSGNKSKHIQLFFPELMRVHSSEKRKKLKELFVRWLCGCKRNYPSCSYCDGDRTGKGEIDCFVVLNNIDMQLMGKHLIRMEYATHPKTGRPKVLNESYSLDTPNRFPKKVVRQFNHIKKHIVPKVKTIKHIGKMMCLHYFINSNLDDCRERVMFSLASHLVKSKGAQDTRDILYQWNKNIQDGHLRQCQIEGVIKGTMKSNKSTGCMFNKKILQELDLLSVCDYCVYNKSNKNGIDNPFSKNKEVN